VEWKWDGIRVQVAAGRHDARLFSRAGDDISRSFPDLMAGLNFRAVLDGELLIVRGGEVAPFNNLQQRLNRKTLTARMLADYPAHIRFYDALEIEGADLRAFTLTERRARLEEWYARARPLHSDISELLFPASKAALMQLWQEARGMSIEGLMLKRRSSPYIAGRPKGHWFKWKRAALTLDCVLMYAQRGSGKRSSYYSDYTFGAWTADIEGRPELVPVGKAYSGYTDAELLELDRWVRNHTTERFGPVRAVAPGLVLEVAFDAVQRSTRHKSGIAMRFPRISRIRWDKPAAEADRLEAFIQLIDDKM
jgi:ATP-dependent DNA ligase